MGPKGPLRDPPGTLRNPPPPGGAGTRYKYRSLADPGTYNGSRGDPPLSGGVPEGVLSGPWLVFPRKWPKTPKKGSKRGQKGPKRGPKPPKNGSKRGQKGVKKALFGPKRHRHKYRGRPTWSTCNFGGSALGVTHTSIRGFYTFLGVFFAFWPKYLYGLHPGPTPHLPRTPKRGFPRGTLRVLDPFLGLFWVPPRFMAGFAREVPKNGQKRGSKKRGVSGGYPRKPPLDPFGPLWGPFGPF